MGAGGLASVEHDANTIYSGRVGQGPHHECHPPIQGSFGRAGGRPYRDGKDRAVGLL